MIRKTRKESKLMLHIASTDAVVDYPPHVVFQALLATDLTAFTEFAFGVVRPGIAFKPNWHFEAVTEKLSQVASGKVRRLIITLPPRTLKSLCASVALPAWFLGRNPAERVIVVSYSDILARTHANDFRLLVNHPMYRAAFPGMRLERDTDREIVTSKRGKRIATSIDGTLTGLGGNLIIIDDPLKLGDAMSEAVRTRVIDWYRSTLLSRSRRQDRGAHRSGHATGAPGRFSGLPAGTRRLRGLEPPRGCAAGGNLLPRCRSHLHPPEGRAPAPRAPTGQRPG
jgi:hypothetical protein